MIRTIKFNDDDLKKAFGKHFDIDPEKITFWHIRSILGNNHVVEYHDEVI